MISRPFVLTTSAALGVLALIASILIRPITASAQQNAPIVRILGVTIVPTNTKEVLKAHVGIYLLAEYQYSSTGKMTSTKKNDLIVEQDVDLRAGFGRLGQRLTTGEYEIHIQPDNARPIIKRFIVDNLSTAAIGLSFDIAPVEDPAERKKIELVRIGPSLAELEAQIQTLSDQVAELKKKN